MAGCGGGEQASSSSESFEPIPAAAGPMLEILEKTEDLEGPSRLAEQRLHFYRERGFELAWIHEGRGGEAAEELIRALLEADRHGLDSTRYDGKNLEQRLQKLHRVRAQRPDHPDLPEEVRSLDVALTTAFLLYGSHLAHGTMPPTSGKGAWGYRPRNVDLVAALGKAITETGVEETLAALAPAALEYRQLQELLVRYRRLAEEGGWPQVPDGPMLEIGESAERARLDPLVERLRIEGDLSPIEARWIRQTWSNREDLVYGSKLALGVAKFQQRHGLGIDGKLGPATHAALTPPASRRVRQIVVNLERWRWVPPQQERSIRVNLAAQELEAWDDGAPALHMRVVVGRESWPTPVFEDRITHVVVNPYWYVPDSIEAAEVLPAVRKDPGYLDTQRFEVLDPEGNLLDPAEVQWAELDPTTIRIRQRPGNSNALGRVKFHFPNRFGVYLHDTPADHLFDEPDRAASHGCVRVEKPVELADFVLGEGRRDEFEQALASRATIHLALDEPLAVRFHYFTAFAEGEKAQFRDDVYDHDRAVVLANNSWLAPDLEPVDATRPAVGEKVILARLRDQGLPGGQGSPRDLTSRRTTRPSTNLR